MSQLADRIKGALEQRATVLPQGKGWSTRCPNPSHEDRHPSFFLYPGGGGRCFSQCARYWPPQELAALLGVELPSTRQGLTVAALAQAKGLSEEFLRSLGVVDGVTGVGQDRLPCVDIPYMNEAGEVEALRKRVSLEGQPRFLWRRGDQASLYGRNHLKDIRKAGRVVLTEGESDCWTLWHSRIPALGLPGASTWKEHYAPLLQGLVVYVWHEPDGGGDGLVKAISSDLPEVRIIEAPPGAKDPSDLYLQGPEGFIKGKFDLLLSGARPASEIRAEALSAEARECSNAARMLLDSPDLLTKLTKTITALGYAGDARPAVISYIAVTSRLTDNPLNLAYISPSAAGKNAAVEAPLPLFPETAYYLVRASSPRALVYNNEAFTHRIVILTEADSLPEEGPAASAMRSLMSDREMSYEVVEKGKDGTFQVRKIVKLGPNGLITTSIKSLGEQATTRTLTVTIPDSEQQTRLVLRVQAARANEGLPTPDLRPWVALQRWLELAGERRVVVPFARALADLVPATAVRMRRDFPQLLTVIQTIAVLRQRQRQRDAQGRVIATLDDYAEARLLLEEVFTTTVHEGVTPAIRETVEAVASLSPNGTPITEHQLVQRLGLAKSTIHDRVRRAARGSWLVNQTTRRGAPAQLVLGAPLPDGHPLPEVDALRVCAETPESDPNRRTPPGAPATEQIQADGSNPSSNPPPTGTESGEGFGPGSGGPTNRPPKLSQLGLFEGFGRFEPFPGGTTHKEAEETGSDSAGGEDADDDAGVV